MAVFHIKRGRDIPLIGRAERRKTAAAVPERISVRPADFTGLRLRLRVKEGDAVLAGTTLLEDKGDPRIRIVSPLSGRVEAVRRGEKRALLDVIVAVDGRDAAETFPRHSASALRALTREQVVARLLEGGLWPCLRQRPFSRVARPQDSPKAIFVRAMDTEPLGPDVDFILDGREEEFSIGLSILSRLTAGKIHVCHAPGAASGALTGRGPNPRVRRHVFHGPHPAGNVGTHIHHLDPIRHGDVVWYVHAEDVLRIAGLFTEGRFSAECTVVVAGEAARRREYRRTVLGAPLKTLTEADAGEARWISGGILTGRDAGPEGFLGFYDRQVTLLPEGGRREFLGWLRPGGKRYSFSRLFLSAFRPGGEVSLDTDTHGGRRAIVLNHVYDRYVALDVMTYFLIRALSGGDLDEAERLGLLECDPEDFALCSFACPSKVDVGRIIREGLEQLAEEG